MQEKVSIMCSWCGWENPSGFVQQGGDSASLVTAYAALRPRDGFSHPHQEHMKYTYILKLESLRNTGVNFCKNKHFNWTSNI